MGLMFTTASAFEKDVTGWNVCKVDNFQNMFGNSGQPGTNLEPDTNGACIACPANSFSGSGEYVRGQNPCNNLPCLDNGNFNTALGLWFSNPTLAESTYGNITDW